MSELFQLTEPVVDLADEFAAIFRENYPACKRNTHAERLKPAMRKWVKTQGAVSVLELRARFQLAMSKLLVHKRSERWLDAAFVPHMASWWNSEYFNHELEQYRPARLGKDDACPDCGRTFRVHLPMPSRPGERANQFGSYCPA